MEAKQVTAQDFIDLLPKESTMNIALLCKLTGVHVGFEKLLSRARQEARREALKEMDEARNWLDSQIYPVNSYGPNIVARLRQEYSNQP